MEHEDEDVAAWYQYPTLRWMYDRLQLCEKLHYQCGPAATIPPEGKWFIKPQINLLGMGLGAQQYFGQYLLPGYFWMPYFEGQQTSVDFHFVEGRWIVREVLTVKYEGGRPKVWKRITPSLDYHNLVPAWFFSNLQLRDVTKCNIEFIGDKMIEMHLRWGGDFDEAPPEATRAEVVWADEVDSRPYIENYEDCFGALAVPRLGFRYF